MEQAIVLIRGAGEQATGVAWTLAKAGFRVVMTEVAKPLMVRWPVCFGTAIAEGRWQVEGITARKIDHLRHLEAVWQEREIPVLIDPYLINLTNIKPVILVDAIMAKCNTGTKKEMASLTIGLGPGFTAGGDVDLVIETNRGHDLGRIIYSGQAEANTGIPGLVGGAAQERVIYSAGSGIFKAAQCIGSQVRCGEVLGTISDGSAKTEVISPLDGVLRGLILTDTPVQAGVKIGDVDPRGHREYCFSISDKARAIGSAVLLGIMEWQNQ